MVRLLGQSSNRMFEPSSTVTGQKYEMINLCAMKTLCSPTIQQYTNSQIRSSTRANIFQRVLEKITHIDSGKWVAYGRRRRTRRSWRFRQDLGFGRSGLWLRGAEIELPHNDDAGKTTQIGTNTFPPAEGRRGFQNFVSGWREDGSRIRRRRGRSSKNVGEKESCEISESFRDRN